MRYDHHKSAGVLCHSNEVPTPVSWCLCQLVAKCDLRTAAITRCICKLPAATTKCSGLQAAVIRLYSASYPGLGTPPGRPQIPPAGHP